MRHRSALTITRQRTRELFDHWFDAELTDTVVDLIPEEPLTSLDMEHAVVADALQRCELELEPNEGRNVALRVPAAAGEDLIFRACSSWCEKLIRKAAPRALRRLLERPSVH